MPRAGTVLHGRDAAFGRAVECLGAPEFRMLTLEGPSGIGKTAILERLVATTTEQHTNVLSARATEAESVLPYVGLTDLFDSYQPLVDDLPSPMRESFERAVLRSRIGEGIERHAVGRAVSMLLDRLAAEGPVLVAVDDVQWLDPPTAAALAFALRRHAVASSAAVLTFRPVSDQPVPILVEQTHDRVLLGPLGPDDLDRIVRDRVGVTFPRTRLIELHELSQGNPLHAIEIAKAAVELGDAQGPLPVPGPLAATIEQRLRGLQPPGLDATLAVALAGDIDERSLATALGGRDGLDEAVRHETVEVSPAGRLRCAHPMFASVAVATSTPWQIRRIHVALAGVVTDDVSRMRHRALGADGPDEELAADLETAAEQLAIGAAPEAAALLARLATRVSAGDDARRRRTYAEANYLVAAGDSPRAEAVLEGLAREQAPSHELARTLLLLADTVGDHMERSVQLAQRALELAEGDPLLTAECHQLLEVLTWLAGNPSQSAHHCRKAAEYAEMSGDDAQLAVALAELCHLDVLLGCRYDEAMMARALELESRVTLPVTTSPTYLAGLLATFTDDLDRARPLLDTSLAAATAQGDDSLRATVFFRLAELDLRAGRWGDALRNVRTFHTLALQALGGHEQGIATGAVALVAAHVGLVDEARENGVAALAMAQEIGDRMSEVRSRAVLGFLELSLGDVRAARTMLEPAQEMLDVMAIAELSIHHVSANLVDVRVLDGDLDGARALVDRIRSAGEPAGRSWHRVVADRGAAMVLAGAGDLDGAFELATRAVDGAPPTPQPFEQARALLVLGDVCRRAKRRAEARTHLTLALERFDELGAPLWADKAASAIARIGGRAPSAEQGMTKMEQAVVDLVVRGRTNREIAAELFVAVRTVEATLTRVYGKVGVRSRSELVARLAEH